MSDVHLAQPGLLWLLLLMRSVVCCLSSFAFLENAGDRASGSYEPCGPVNPTWPDLRHGGDGRARAKGERMQVTVDG